MDEITMSGNLFHDITTGEITTQEGALLGSPWLHTSAEALALEIRYRRWANGDEHG